MVYKKKFTEISESINNLSTGVVTNYALYILAGLIFFIQVAYFSQYVDINVSLIIILMCLICIITVKDTKSICYSQHLLHSDIPDISSLTDFLSSMSDFLDHYKNAYDKIDTKNLPDADAWLEKMEIRNNFNDSLLSYFEKINGCNEYQKSNSSNLHDIFENKEHNNAVDIVNSEKYNDLKTCHTKFNTTISIDRKLVGDRTKLYVLRESKYDHGTAEQIFTKSREAFKLAKDHLHRKV